MAKDLVQESQRKYDSLREMVKKVGLSDRNANDVVEYCYDIIIYLIRAKLSNKGFKSSGVGSHEAEISYMVKLNFSENDIRFVDELRYFRNGIKYYCKRFEEAYAEKVLNFLDKNYSNLYNLIDLS